MAKQEFHPVIYEYLKKYQDDPTSRVFAPLAESYRKAGLLDEAISVCREGLRIHPGFVGGRVALARALFDKGHFHEVIDELSPVSQDVPDNLIAQRLMAESCLMLGRVVDALSAYKMLLYFAPQDLETARIVHELEEQAYQKGTLVLRTDPEPERASSTDDFDVQPAAKAIDSDPGLKRRDWMRRVEFLQSLLQKIERYRINTSHVRNQSVSQRP